MGVLFIILFYATLHVSAYKQAILRGLLTNHKNTQKIKLLSYFSVDPPSHDITQFPHTHRITVQKHHVYKALFYPIK
jgi:hypothetical protein